MKKVEERNRKIFVPRIINNLAIYYPHKEANIMIENRIDMNSIYDEVIAHYGWGAYEDSKKRLLRKKYSFLQKNLVLCDPEDFKEKGTNYVPKNDAPIIRNLLIAAVDDSEKNIIVDWFNGKVDTSDSQMAFFLFSQLKPLIMEPCMMCETDDVTMDEWLHTVVAAVNYSTAMNTIALKRNLEKFRNTSLPLDSTVSYGDVIATHEDGSRSYGMKADRKPVEIKGKTVEQILDTVVTQDDYFSVLEQILALFDAHAKAKAREKIEWYAEAKDLFEAEKADDAIERDSIASEYTIWYQRVSDFLAQNPDICAEIEKKAGTTGLVEFFKMQDR